MSATKTGYVIFDAYRQDRRTISEHKIKNVILREYGIPTTNCELAMTEEDAAGYAEQIGYPVVLKIVSQDILHKTEAGGVILDVKTKEDVKDGYRKILRNAMSYKRDARISGVLVEEMLPHSSSNIELIIGTTKDPQFGNRIMFGWGGMYTEILKDVSNRIALIDDEAEFKQELREMIGETKIGKALHIGIRGRKYYVESLVDVLYKTAKLVEDNPEIKELDFNPVMVFPVEENQDKPTIKVLDARIILEEPESETAYHVPFAEIV